MNRFLFNRHLSVALLAVFTCSTVLTSISYSARRPIVEDSTSTGLARPFFKQRSAVRPIPPKPKPPKPKPPKPNPPKPKPPKPKPPKPPKWNKRK
jgi:hypothetical protein